MNVPQHSGLLIAFEGIDGSGKSSLARNLYEQLTILKKPVLLTKEPAGTPLGEKLYTEYINSTFNITAKTEFLLFAASRAEHFNKVVIPHLQQKYVVLSDRMADSSLVYQGYAQGLDLTMLKTINSWAMNTINPDVTFYLKITADIACQRIQQRTANPDVFERKQAFLEQSILGFDALYHNRTDVITLDGTQSLEYLTKIALQEILNRFKKIS